MTLVTCEAKRILDAENSIFKIDVGKSITWRTGYNSFPSERSERTKHDVSREMRTEI